ATGVSPAVVYGLTATAPGPVRATVTDPNQHKTTWQLDARGRPLQETAADGGLYQWARDGNGRVTAFTDPLTRTTSYALDAAGYPTLETLPGVATRAFHYQVNFHALVS